VIWKKRLCGARTRRRSRRERHADRKTTVKTSRAARCRRIFLVEECVPLRNALARWINRTGDLTVCGQAGGLKRAVRGITRSKPDLVVMEFRLKNGGGPLLLRTMARLKPRPRVLVLSSQNEALYAPCLLASGADDYLMKGVDGARLVSHIRDAANGRAVPDPAPAGGQWPGQRSRARRKTHVNQRKRRTGRGTASRLAPAFSGKPHPVPQRCPPGTSPASAQAFC
jgi:DNA-binding NarL/FixJ family response regulator